MNILEQAADCLEKGERYEVLGAVYKLIIEKVLLCFRKL